jgi:Carbohydrate binding module (family 6)
MSTPTPTVYRSRSRVTRRRVIVGAGVLVLVLIGFLIGRLNSGGSVAKAVPASVPSASPSVAPSASPSAPPSVAAPLTGVDAYSPIQAEAAAAQQGTDTQDTSDAGGGQNVGWVANGDWLRFDDLNFGDTPPKQLVARLSSDVHNDVSRLEVRIDTMQNPPIGTLPVFNTGGWDAWRTQTTDVTAVTGVHTVFLTFASDAGDDFLNLNYFSFSH